VCCCLLRVQTQSVSSARVSLCQVVVGGTATSLLDFFFSEKHSRLLLLLLLPFQDEARWRFRRDTTHDNHPHTLVQHCHTHSCRTVLIHTQSYQNHGGQRHFYGNPRKEWHSKRHVHIVCTRSERVGPSSLGNQPVVCGLVFCSVRL
jgi:hypothetical protein